MGEFIEWFSKMENTKPLALVIFFVVFVGIVVYVYTGKKRRDRLESYKHIPFQDEDDHEQAKAEPGEQKEKGSGNG